MLQNIAQYESLKNAVDEIDPLRILLDYLSSTIDTRVQRRAIEALASPLSRSSVETFTAYLGSKDNLPPLKALILEHLCLRARISSEEARMIADKDALRAIFELLQCSDPEILKLGCQILRNIAYYESLRKKVCETVPHKRLLWCLNHVDLSVQSEAIKALVCILGGGSAEFYLSLDRDVVVHTIDGIQGPLNSHDKEFRGHVYSILGNIGDSPTFRRICRDRDLCDSLVGSMPHISEIWNDETIPQRQINILHVLVFICAGSVAGANAAIKAKAVARSFALLKSPSFDVVRLTCTMLGKIASYSTPDHWMRGFDPCMHLVWLLDHESLDVRQEAAHVLECIKASEEGEQLVTAALDWATQLANLDLHHTFLSLVSESRSD
ncbi:armadillo-type protein [Mycena galericulata]|nr:armadillo-type protein [Mycena galericulata]